MSFGATLPEKTNQGRIMNTRSAKECRTFAGRQLAFQLVVPVSFGGQRRLGFFAVQAVDAAFGLRGGEGEIKASRTGGVAGGDWHV